MVKEYEVDTQGAIVLIRLVLRYYGFQRFLVQYYNIFKQSFVFFTLLLKETAIFFMFFIRCNVRNYILKLKLNNFKKENKNSNLVW